MPGSLQVVTLAEVIPVPGSGIALPLDLHFIAARCKNAFYAPKKFAAVQLAYKEPRCRILVFRAPPDASPSLRRSFSNLNRNVLCPQIRDGWLEQVWYDCTTPI